MQLHQHQAELQSLAARVWVVTFCPPQKARLLLRETGVRYPILLDPERRLYREYQLERSWLRSWNLPTIWRYARLLHSGRRWRGIQGDSAQLGADLLIDPTGQIRMAHYSHDPTDRPALEEIFLILERIRLAGMKGETQ